MAYTIEIRFEDEAEHIMRMIAQNASPALSREELIKRWLSKGLAFDSQKPEDHVAFFVDRFVTVRRK